MQKFFFIPVALTLVGCTQTITPTSIQDQQMIARTLPIITQGHGQICVSRVGDAYRCDKGLKFKFSTDYDQIIGDIRTGNEYFCANLQPGTHHISGTANSFVYYAGASLPTETTVSEEIDIRANQRTFMEIQCSAMGDMEFIEVPASRGLTGIFNTDKFAKKYMR